MAGPTDPDLAVVVLAAGRGTRMRSGLPKVLHPLAGRALVGHVLAVAGELGAAVTAVVLSPGSEAVAAEVARAALGARVAVQDPPLGTGHALMAARHLLPGRGAVLVLYGDTPLVTAGTCGRLVAALGGGAAVAALGMAPPDPSGYGRLRMAGDELLELVEERHAEPELRRTALCNAGAMAFDAARLPELLDALPLREGKGEYYLTDAVHLARARGWRAAAVEGPWAEGVGVNSQAQLAEAEALFQARRRAELLDSGVIMPAPGTVHLAADTRIGPGARVEPYVVFGPGVAVGAGAVVHAFSHLEGARVDPGAAVGPFARLRPGAVVGAGARVGNFVEVKNAELGPGAKANHLAYLGDAGIGAGANLGAGTITCNYDGVAKHRTEVGAGAFVGSNATLVAPVTVGAGAFVAAGSTVTRDVPPDALAFGRARQAVLEGRGPALRERLAARAAARNRNKA